MVAASEGVEATVDAMVEAMVEDIIDELDEAMDDMVDDAEVAEETAELTVPGVTVPALEASGLELLPQGRTTNSIWVQTVPILMSYRLVIEPLLH